MGEEDYNGVVQSMRTVSHGALFGLPVVLDVTDTSLLGKNVTFQFRAAITVM